MRKIIIWALFVEWNIASVITVSHTVSCAVSIALLSHAVIVVASDVSLIIHCIRSMNKERDAAYRYEPGKVLRSIPSEYRPPPRRVPKGQTLWITREVSNSWDDTRKPASSHQVPPQLPRRRSWILGPVIRTVYTCVYTIFCRGLLPRRPQCSGPRQVFSYLIDPSPGQGSDKRLIFLRANDLRIPDVLHLFLLPSPPTAPFSFRWPISLLLSLPAAAHRAFYVHLFAKLRSHRKRSGWDGRSAALVAAIERSITP